jgi:hypothetical protein
MIDIETIAPEGVTIVMTNTTIAVTNENIETPDRDNNESLCRNYRRRS